MAYIDAFLAAVPRDSKDDYLAFCEVMHPLILEFGADRVFDGWDDDVPEGQLTSMRSAVQAEPDEVIAISWIVWPDKPARDAGMQKMMTDPRSAQAEMPFEGKRMIYGGFTPLLGEP